MKNNTFRTILMAFGITLFFSVNSFAQSQDRGERKEPPTFEKLIEEMDANEDGKLAKDEVKGRLEKNFEKIDTDEDGFITEEEFEKGLESRPKGRGNN